MVNSDITVVYANTSEHSEYSGNSFVGGSTSGSTPPKGE